MLESLIAYNTDTKKFTLLLDDEDDILLSDDEAIRATFKIWGLDISDILGETSVEVVSESDTTLLYTLNF